MRLSRMRAAVGVLVTLLISSVLAVASAPAIGAAELVDVNVRLADNDHVVVEWSTDAPTSSTLVYGTDVEYGQAWIDPNVASEHRADLVDLECDTTYHFSIISLDENDVSTNSGDRTFHTGACAYDENGVASVQVVAYADSAIVTWGSAVPGRGTLVFGPTEDFGAAVAEPDHLVTFHRVELTGLECDTTYFMYGLTEGVDEVESTGLHQFTTYACDPFSNDVTVDAGATTATITWTTDAPAEGSVIFGETRVYGQEVRTGLLGDVHRVDLAELPCARTFHFRVISFDEEGTAYWTPDATFTTAACDSDEPVLPGSDADAPAAPVIADVLVDQAEHAIGVSWATDEATSGSVIWGPEAATGNEAVSYQLGTEHRAVVYDLECDTEIVFVVTATDAQGLRSTSEPLTVSTAPCASGVVLPEDAPVPQPDVDAPAVDEPAADEPVADEPAAPIVDEPAEPVTDEPTQPVADEPAEPVADEPAEPAADEPAEPAADEPVVDEPAEPVTDEPTEPAADEPVVDEPVVDEPAEPVTDEPAEPVEVLTVSDVIVRDVTKTSAAVVWSTSTPASGSVVFGTTTAYGSEAVSAIPGLTQRVLLTGLECGTDYDFSPLAYSVDGTAVVNGGPGSFSTLPCDAAAIDDVQVESSEYALVISWTTDVPADGLVLFGTDVTYGSATYTPIMGTSQELVLGDLECGTDYQFRIVADAGVGAATFTSNLTGTTLDCPAPDVPVVVRGPPLPLRQKSFLPDRLEAEVLVLEGQTLLLLEPVLLLVVAVLAVVGDTVFLLDVAERQDVVYGTRVVPHNTKPW